MLKLLLLVGLGLVACGGAEGGEQDAGSKELAACPVVCEAGKVSECACVGGVTGVQTCEDDGSKWGTCSCADESLKPKAYQFRDVCTLISEGKFVCGGEGAGNWGAGQCTIPPGGYLDGCRYTYDVSFPYCCF